VNEVIYTRDVSSGRIHKRYRMPGGNLATYESCNLDDAGDYVIISLTAQKWRVDGTPVLADSDAEALCKRCFPEDDDG
jgi:hypothetical protein